MNNEPGSSRQTFLPYLTLKRALLSAGLLSCSQVGFNITMGPLAELKRNIAEWLCSLDPEAEAWETPALIRRDWVETGVWDNPPPDQWCEVQPFGHLLTPRPLMHLFNRLRHHPVEHGRFVLHGQCFRQEEDTLPLLRQVAFEAVEHVALDASGNAGTHSREVCAKLARQAQSWGLPVVANEHPSGLGTELALSLPETPQVNLVRLHVASPTLLSAYKMADYSVVTVGIGVERMCLAIVARFGVDPGGWPKLGGLLGEE